MAHVSIFGMTESGKTTLAKKLAAEYKARGIQVIVLDPLHDPGWPSDFRTADKNEFMTVVKASRQCAVFIDESGKFVGRYETEMEWLGTMARHWGHNSHFISQRAQMVNPTVRGQCGFLALFNVSKTDAKILADEWNRDDLQKANSLQQGEYFWCPRFGELEKRSVF